MTFCCTALLLCCGHGVYHCARTSDDEYMYVTYVPVYNSVSSADDPDYQEVAQSIEVLRYARATAFQATNTAVTVLSFECIAFYPQASNPMVDRVNGYLYLICGGDITRVSLTPATLGQASAMCSGPIPDGKMAQYYWPRTVPQSQVRSLCWCGYASLVYLASNSTTPARLRLAGASAELHHVRRGGHRLSDQRCGLAGPEASGVDQRCVPL